MIKGPIVTKPLSADDVLRLTNGGHDIYMAYLGKCSRIMDRPWGNRKEAKKSWGVFAYSGVWFWKDLATEEVGNAITFVERHFGLSFSEAMSKIRWDFGLGQGKELNVSPVVRNWEAPYADKEYAKIKFSDQPFKKQHSKFWDIVEVPESHCHKMNCFALKDAAINGKKLNIRPDEAAFAFYCPEEDAVKLYFPERSEHRFKNNVSYHHLWNYSNVQECEDLIIQKSPKDMIVTSMIQPCVIATQAEAVKIFDEDTVKLISKISLKPWVWYGSDQDGVVKCTEITGTRKWRYVNTPKELLPDINDTYSYTSVYKLKGLEEFMKLKKLI